MLWCNSMDGWDPRLQGLGISFALGSSWSPCSITLRWLMVVYALATTVLLWKWPRMAVALILAFLGLLRPAEIIGLRRLRQQEARAAKWRRLAARQRRGCHSNSTPKRLEQRCARRQVRWLRGLAREVGGRSRLPRSSAHQFPCRKRQGGSGEHGATPDKCAMHGVPARALRGPTPRPVAHRPLASAGCHA